MILVQTNKENFQYDIHSLTKAFFPEQDVKVVGLETDSENMTDMSGKIEIVLEENFIDYKIEKI